MKKTILTLSLTLLTALLHAQGAAPSPADTLRQRLAACAGEGTFLFGHHDDTAYGHSWSYEPGRSDVKETTGKYPSLMSWDLGLIEWQRDKELDGVPFSLIRDEVARQDARGGVNTFSWHLRNPLTRGDSWDVADITADPLTRPVARVLEAGSPLADTLRTWIGRAATFIGSLRRADGSRIPVIFRPWHEHTGSWFWWGCDYCTPDEYRQLWQLTREVFDEQGIDNVVWAWSPDVVSSYAQYMERYPGDALVDIVGADVYHRDGEAGTSAYRERLGTTLTAARQAAAEHHKIMALTETGCEALPIANWWTGVLLPEVEKYPIAYLCVWRNAHDNPTHFFAPFKGQLSAKDFKKFCKKKKVIMK